jgi:SAM-dependent methyltransferase
MIEKEKIRINTARDFYKKLGFNEYACIDADGKKDSFLFDLNENLAEKYNYKKQFNLVTNHGTTEHVFDQAKIFDNTHNLCKKGGIMIHAIPFQGFVNHGFYSYQPSFFHQLAMANDYELINIYLQHDVQNGIQKIIPFNNSSKKFFQIFPLPPATRTLLYVILRKTKEGKFQIPFDKDYVSQSKLQKDYKQGSIVQKENGKFRIIDGLRVWRNLWYLYVRQYLTATFKGLFK